MVRMSAELASVQAMLRTRATPSQPAITQQGALWWQDAPGGLGRRTPHALHSTLGWLSAYGARSVRIAWVGRARRYLKRRTYTRSVAANSMVGYLVGLGDRHR